MTGTAAVDGPLPFPFPQVDPLTPPPRWTELRDRCPIAPCACPAAPRRCCSRATTTSARSSSTPHRCSARPSRPHGWRRTAATSTWSAPTRWTFSSRRPGSCPTAPTSARRARSCSPSASGRSPSTPRTAACWAWWTTTSCTSARRRRARPTTSCSTARRAPTSADRAVTAAPAAVRHVTAPDGVRLAVTVLGDGRRSSSCPAASRPGPPSCRSPRRRPPHLLGVGPPRLRRQHRRARHLRHPARVRRRRRGGGHRRTRRQGARLLVRCRLRTGGRHHRDATGAAGAVPPDVGALLGAPCPTTVVVTGDGPLRSGADRLVSALPTPGPPSSTPATVRPNDAGTRPGWGAGEHHRPALGTRGRLRLATSVRTRPGNAVGAANLPVEAWSDRARVRRAGGGTAVRRSTGRGVLVTDFRDRAACRDVDPELFFPLGDGGPAQARVDAAKAVCRRCPVRLSCLDLAMSTGQDEGVWGGLDPRERRRLRRVRRAA